MDQMTDLRFPLAWPEGWPRTPIGARKNEPMRFGRGSHMTQDRRAWTFGDARDALQAELERLGAADVILSSNFTLTLSGLPAANKQRPADQGIAIYFKLRGKAMVMAQDQHVRAEENMRSLALAMDAFRTLERHGGQGMMERAFTGFLALPPPVNWRRVLGLDGPDDTITVKAIEAAFRDRAKTAHPDQPGGSKAKMIELNLARDSAMKAIAE